MLIVIFTHSTNHPWTNGFKSNYILKFVNLYFVKEVLYSGRLMSTWQLQAFRPSCPGKKRFQTFLEGSINLQKLAISKNYKNIILKHNLFSSCAQLPRIAGFLYTSVWPLLRSCPGLSRPLPLDVVLQQVPWLSQISSTTRALLWAQLRVPVLVAIFDTWSPAKGRFTVSIEVKILALPRLA